jgi:hypothetical protein
VTDEAPRDLPPWWPLFHDSRAEAETCPECGRPAAPEAGDARDC